MELLTVRIDCALTMETREGMASPMPILAVRKFGALAPPCLGENVIMETELCGVVR